MLGITGRPSDDEPKGLLVTGFLPSPAPWPLERLGVKVGDTIIMCNGQQQQIGGRLLSALDGLQDRGESITLVVLREGKRVELERGEKFPAAEASEKPK